MRLATWMSPRSRGAVQASPFRQTKEREYRQSRQARPAGLSPRRVSAAACEAEARRGQGCGPRV